MHPWGGVADPAGNQGGAVGLDQVAGTNVSGAHPENEDGTVNNPPGTAASRATDDVTRTTDPLRKPGL